MILFRLLREQKINKIGASIRFTEEEEMRGEKMITSANICLWQKKSTHDEYSKINVC